MILSPLLNLTRKTLVCEVDKLQTKGKPNLLVRDTKNIYFYFMLPRRRYKQTNKEKWLAGNKANVENLSIVVWHASLQRSRKRWQAEKKHRKTRIEESSKEDHLSPWEMNLLNQGWCFGKALGNTVWRPYLHCLMVPLTLYPCSLIICMRKKSHRRSYHSDIQPMLMLCFPCGSNTWKLGGEWELSLPDWGHCLISKYTHELVSYDLHLFTLLEVYLIQPHNQIKWFPFHLLYSLNTCGAL